MFAGASGVAAASVLAGADGGTSLLGAYVIQPSSFPPPAVHNALLHPIQGTTSFPCDGVPIPSAPPPGTPSTGPHVAAVTTATATTSPYAPLPVGGPPSS